VTVAFWLVVLFVVVPASTVGLAAWRPWVAWRPWDPHVPEAKARAAVSARFGHGQLVRCERSEQTDDGSLPGLGDVDYDCRVGPGQGFPRVFVGSNSQHVTSIYSYGGP
jgi:hypothetical protein